MALVDSLIVLVAGLLIGGLAIHIAARIIVGPSSYTHAVFTALIGAIVYSIVSGLVGGIPGLGPIIALLAWIAVINWRYHGGWIDSALIGFVAWLSVLVVLYILASLGFTSFTAVGIPGV